MARRARRSRSEGHLYRDGARHGELRKFENRYGKENGAVVGKVKRERARKKR